MFYDFAITVSANTTEADPASQVMKLTKGVLHRVEVQFPAGCAGLAHCQIYEDSHQFLPTNPDGDFASDDHTIVIDENRELTAAPYRMRAVCWNEDDTYSHTIYIRIGVLRGEMALLFQKVLTGLSKFLRFMGVRF